MDEGAYHVDVSVAMRDHHALRPRGGTAGVIDRQEIGFMNFRPRKFCRSSGEKRLVVEPTWFARAAFKCNKRRHASQLRTNFINRIQVIGMSADDLRAAVIDEVNEVAGS